MREELLGNATRFLGHLSVRTASDEKKRTFLQNKGLTAEEIDEAFSRYAATNPATSVVLPSAVEPPAVYRTHQPYSDRSYYGHIQNTTGVLSQILSGWLVPALVSAGIVGIGSQLWYRYCDWHDKKQEKDFTIYNEATDLLHEELANFRSEVYSTLEEQTNQLRLCCDQIRELVAHQKSSAQADRFRFMQRQNMSDHMLTTTEALDEKPFSRTIDEFGETYDKYINESGQNFENKSNEINNQNNNENRYNDENRSNYNDGKMDHENNSNFNDERIQKFNENYQNLENQFQTQLLAVVDCIEQNGSVKSEGALTLLLLLLKNLVLNPSNTKYSKINSLTPRFQERFDCAFDTAFEFLNIVGFQRNGYIYEFDESNIESARIALKVVEGILQSNERNQQNPKYPQNKPEYIEKDTSFLHATA